MLSDAFLLIFQLKQQNHTVPWVKIQTNGSDP
jgi:hypothetical protein